MKEIIVSSTEKTTYFDCIPETEPFQENIHVKKYKKRSHFFKTITFTFF